MVLRQSPDTRVMSCFHVKCSLSSACLVSCWSVVFGSRHSCLEFWFRVGVLTLVRHVSLCVCVLTSCLLCLSCVVIFVTFLCCHVPVLFLVFLVRDTRWLRALLSTCVARSSCFYRLCAFVSCAVWHAAWVFSLAACFHVVMSCVNTWLMSIVISCVFVSRFAHVWWFLFCWPCACVFVLCEHMAFVLVFCVSCAVMSIVLTPPIFLPDYWLICPTCLPSLPSSFAPFIISFLLQFWASSLSNVSWPCLVLPCQALPVVLFSPTG